MALCTASPRSCSTSDDWIPAAELRGELEHVAKWPAEHWTLAFQGQLRTISAADRDLLLGRMRAPAGAPA